jgi:peptide/nickel transport system permease protein
VGAEAAVADINLLLDEPEVGRSERAQGWRRIVGQLARNPSSAAGTLILVGFILVAVFAPVLAPCPPGQLAYCDQNPFEVPKFGFKKQPLPPGTVADGDRYEGYVHRFGTTPDQYDIYYGVVWGARTAFQAALIVTSVTLLIGLTVGSIAGYYGGWTDEALMRVVEVVMAFPFLLAAITMATILRSHPQIGQGIVPSLLALIAFGWTGYSRLIRADILSVKQREYVWASKSLGASDFSIITKHVLPNAMFPVLVVASLDIGTIVLSFAALSFLGVGVPDGYADWGQMIAGARDRLPSLDEDWYIIVFPGAAITLFVLAWNLLGDAFRDILDPRFTKTSKKS